MIFGAKIQIFQKLTIELKKCHFWRENSNEKILMIFIHCDVIHEEFFCHYCRSAETTEACGYGQVIGMQIAKKQTTPFQNQRRSNY